MLANSCRFHAVIFESVASINYCMNGVVMLLTRYRWQFISAVHVGN